MASNNRLFDEFTRIVSDATGAAQGVRREAETVIKGQIERLLRDMNVATREELDVVRDMVAELRLENEALKGRVQALEGPKVTTTKPANDTASHD